MLRERIARVLPTGKSLIIIGVILFLVVAIVVVFFLLTRKESFVSQKKPSFENKTILSMMQADTDKDGVLDWEEALWGTDKNNPTTFDGVADSVFIEGQKKNSSSTQENENIRLTETEKFAREFFSAYMTMQAGEVDEITITSFANALGQRVVNPALIDPYTAKDVKVLKEDTAQTRTKYYETIRGFFDDARGLGVGNELDILSGGMLGHNSTGSAVDFSELTIIANAYQEFAGEVMTTEAPGSVQDLHLQIANSAHNVGLSVENAAKIIDDPVMGLSGLAQYQKYSEDLVNAVTDMGETLF